MASIVAKLGALQPENLEGGTENLMIYYEILTDRLKGQVAASSPKKSRGIGEACSGVSRRSP
jgi:hypothetical protein